MRRRDRLYTANKWNQPLFAQGVDRENYNIFDGENGSFLNTGGIGQSNFGMGNSLISGLKSPWQLGMKDPNLITNINNTIANSGFNPLISWGIGSSINKENPNTVDPFGIQKDFKNRTNSIVKKAQGIVDTAKSFVPKSVPTVSSRIANLAAADRLANPWNYTLDGGSTVSQYLNSTNKLGISKANNPFSKANIGDTAATAAMVAAPIANSLISDGFSTKEGEGITGLGNAVAAGLAATGVGAVPAAIVSVASNLVGGVLNRGGGVKWNNKGKAIVEGTTQALNSSANNLASQNTNEGIMDAWGQTDFGTEFSKGDIGKDGWWGHKAKKEYRRQKQLRKEAQERARRGFTLGVENADSTMDDLAQSNFIYANGGALDIMQQDKLIDALNNNNQAANMNPLTTYDNYPYGMDNPYSLLGSALLALGGPKRKKERVYSSGSWKLPSGWKEEGIRTPHGNYYRRTINESGPDTIYTYQPTNMYSPKYMFEDSWWTERRVPSGRKTAGYDIIKDEFENYSKDAVDDPNSFIQLKDNIVDAANSVYDWVKEAVTPATRAVKKKANGGSLFAFGGELGTNGTDWTNGLLYVDSGGTHEENPMDGVPMGVDENGTPNLVEEGETVFNDYVFSNRMKVPKELLKEFGLGGSSKKGITFAEASKKIAKESERRPNDNISLAGLQEGLGKLAEIQEAERMKMQLEKTASGQEFAYGGKKGNMFAGPGAKSQSLNPYAYSKSWDGFKYFDPKTNTYSQDYLDFVKNINQDWVNRIMSGQYGSMARYLARNKGITPTIEQVASLATDKKYSDMHKAMAAAFDEYKAGVDPKTGVAPGRGNAGSSFITNDGPWGNLFTQVDTAAREPLSPMEQIARDKTNETRTVTVDPSGLDFVVSDPTPVEDRGVLETERGGGYADPQRGLLSRLFSGDEEGSYPTWMRYAPAFGAGAMAISDLLGFTNRPDYTYADKIEATANRAGYAPNIEYRPIGDYLTYRPMDIWYNQNRMDANARATDRALINNSAPISTRAAGLLANSYNSQLGSGELYRNALEYNDAKRKDVAEFNRKTNMFNSQMGLEAAMANARYQQQARQYQLSGLAQAAALRDAIDQRVGAARAANLTNLLNNLGAIGTENFVFNQINGDSSRHYKYSDRSGNQRYDNGAAYGGKIKKRK